MSELVKSSELNTVTRGGICIADGAFRTVDTKAEGFHLANILWTTTRTSNEKENLGHTL